MQVNGVNFPMQRIDELCQQYGVARLYLFGSILTDRFSSQSDIDILVETHLNQPIGLLALGGFQMDLSELLGRTVHITTLGGVPVLQRNQVLASARVLNAG